MAETTAIEWTDATWNPWIGCRKVSPGCKNCYMFRDQERYGRDPAVVRRAADRTFFAPRGWLTGRRVFTCSWSDFFVEEADEWREAAWEIIRATPHHTYQILTKRPERIGEHLPSGWNGGWPHVWLGVSVESQDYVQRVEQLAEIPARVHFISAEPLLGRLDLSTSFSLYGNHSWWLIAGGESGAHPRPMDLGWARLLRDQAQTLSVPYFLKQLGGSRKIDGAWGGRELDGRTWDEMPKR